MIIEIKNNDYNLGIFQSNLIDCNWCRSLLVYKLITNSSSTEVKYNNL